MPLAFSNNALTSAQRTAKTLDIGSSSAQGFRGKVKSSLRRMAAALHRIGESQNGIAEKKESGAFHAAIRVP